MDTGDSPRRAWAPVAVIGALCTIAGVCAMRTMSPSGVDHRREIAALQQQLLKSLEQQAAMQERLSDLGHRMEAAEAAMRRWQAAGRAGGGGGSGGGGGGEPGAADSLETTGRVPLFGRGPEPLPPVVAATVPNPADDRGSGRRYGGKGDDPHLGGFTANDTQGQSPALWAWMVKLLNVRTFIDVGCGRGISTRWMLDKGVQVLCVEGSGDAVRQSLLPRDRIVQHDFGRGAWWPTQTYDVAWAVEFLEHVGRQRMSHYMGIFQKSALVFVTHSTWGGWHHVEVHEAWWWRARFEAMGFVYSAELTSKARHKATNPRRTGATGPPVRGGAHLQMHLLVFINPRVASLPEHAHLFGGAGCCCLKGTSTPYVCGASGHDPSMNDHDWLSERFLPVWAEQSDFDDSDMEKMNGKDATFRQRLEREGEPRWNDHRRADYERRTGKKLHPPPQPRSREKRTKTP